MTQDQTYTAFSGHSMLSAGPLPQVLGDLKSRFAQDQSSSILVFEDQSGRQVDFDLRGAFDEVLARALPPPPRTGPGRPKLGVVSREISLLPRHWEWLNEQRGGASVTLRKLVEEARKATAGDAKVRRAREACHRFMTTMAGNEPGFEEALRALYAGDAARFAALTEAWPADVRDHARRLADGGLCVVSAES